MRSRPDVVVLKDINALSRYLVEKWRELSGEAIAREGRFSVALSGGETPQPFYRALARDGGDLPWDRIHIFMVDERHVPFDHPDSNFGRITENLIGRVPLPEGNAHPIPFRGTASLSAEEYEAEIKRVFPPGPERFPRFDLIMLGAGEDGHTASLFPGHPALEEDERLALAVGYGGAVHERVTLTLAVINSAGAVFLLESGKEKAGVMRSIIEGLNPEMPGSMVRPSSGRMVFLLDADAASLLGKRG